MKYTCLEFLIKLQKNKSYSTAIKYIICNAKGNVRETLLGERHFVLLLLFNDRLDSLGNFLTSESGTGFLVSKC